MNNEDNNQMKDMAQEEVLVRDYLLRKAHPAPDVQAELDAFMQNIEEEEEPRHRVSRTIGIGAFLAIAASLALVLILYLGKQNGGLQVPEGAVVAYEASNESQHGGVTLQRGDAEPVVVQGNKVVSAADAANGASENSVEAVVRNVLTTPQNATAEVTLPDGSQVMLNAGSKLVYPQAFKGATREVELQGEAYFQVHHDARHPFIVKANGISTKVLGTQFNVRSYAGTASHVTLVQGSVMVSAGGVAKRLKPGEDAVMQGGRLAVRTVDTDAFTAWKEGEFYFDNESLLDIAKEIGKWYQVSVVFQSPEKMHTRLFFAAPRDGRIEELLELLNGLNKAKFIYHEGVVTIE